LPKRREGQRSGISWPVVIIGLLGHGTELGIQTTKKWDWTGNSDSAVFCFREENINSYKEDEMRKVGAKTILRQLCDLRKSCTILFFVQIYAFTVHKAQSFALHSP
jgi:hypothetical protein